MKTFVGWAILLWLALVLENTRPDLFPACSLTVSTATGSIFWMRNGKAVLLAGFALVARWLLQPEAVPVEIVVAILGAAGMVAKAGQHNAWSVSPTGRTPPVHLAWPVLVVFTAIFVHSIFITSFAPAEAISVCAARLMFAIPVILLVQLLAKTADEFGIRKTIST